MKISLAVVTIALVTMITVSPANAASYSKTDVEKHNTKQDCWMIFENKVYDFSESHLQNHEDKYMDIESWCGKDMTTAFQTKDGEGQDHKSFVYNSLSQYLIGDVQASSTNNSTTNNSKRENNNPYNFWLPAILGYGVYTLYWALTTIDGLKKYKFFNKNIFKFSFNTMMLLCLIPVVGFGYFMIARYSYDSLRDIDFDFLYWHVEFGVFFAGLVAGHFLTRFKLYKAPIKLLLRRHTNTTPAAVTQSQA